MTSLSNFSVQTLEAVDTNLDSLRHTPFPNVNASGTRIKSLVEFPQDVQNLNVSRTQIADLSPLAKAERLSVLDVSESRVDDILPLVGKKLQLLNISKTNVAAVPSKISVKELILTDTPVSQLNTVDLQDLVLLDISRTQVTKTYAWKHTLGAYAWGQPRS